MAVFIAFINLSMEPISVTFALSRFVFATPVKYVFTYSLLYVASTAAFALLTVLMYFSIALASASDITPSANAPST